MTDLADEVLPLIRTRRPDLWRWGASNEHGGQMHEALDILETAAETANGGGAAHKEVYAVTHKALASAVKVIARADDSSGIIGDACRRLLALHPVAAARAAVPSTRLVDWMMKFQFDGDVDYFELDPVAYADALGEKGMAAYRARLDAHRGTLGPEPTGDRFWSGPHAHDWFVLQWNEQRLAVLDRDVEEIIRTHAKDRKVAAWFTDTAKALEEIGEIDLAIDWARQASEHDPWHQAQEASRYLCQLLEEHRPAELLPTLISNFRRWPSSSTAAALHRDAGDAWLEYADEVLETLARSPRDAVIFVLHHLEDVEQAWQLAHSLGLDDDRTWSELAKAYAKSDPLAVLPIHRRLVVNELVEAGAQHYRRAARRLKGMRKLAAADATAAEDVDSFIAELREEHYRRPRLQREFDTAGLP